jgi:hypothetical protein
MRKNSDRLINILLLLTVSGFLGMVFCALGWYRVTHRETTIEQLSADERQQLVEDLVNISPGIYRSAWFEPRIGYTLRPDAELTAWGHTFRTNELGYRTGPAAKQPHVFRVLFVGDSWTFGMGVSKEESFPAVFEHLANESGGPGQPVEAWTLALPGYNTLNQCSALRFFYHWLEPDALVICLTPNDNDSLSTVLPNGSLGYGGMRGDWFGDPHPVVYRLRFIDSFRYRSRWARCLAEIRSTEVEMERRNVPMMLTFIADWLPAMAHGLVQESNLSSPYLLIPKRFAGPPWTNPQPVGHGTPEGLKKIGAMVYGGMASLLDWPQLPKSEREVAVQLQRPETVDKDWIREAQAVRQRITAARVPDQFRISRSREFQQQVAGKPIRPTESWVMPPRSSYGAQRAATNSR